MEQNEITTNSSESEKIESPKTDNPSPPIVSPQSSTSSWWSGFISQAKEKSSIVLEAVKNDLNEITSAVTETFQLNDPIEEEISPELDSTQQQQHPATAVNFSNMKQSISSSISTFFGTVTDALVPQIDEEDTSEAILITSDDTIVLTGFKKHLKDLQENDETYLEEPSKTAELAEKYRMWLEVVEQDQFTQQKVDKMLQQSQILNEKYNKFVPDTVSHMNFFKRYLFKKALLEDELADEERKRKEKMVIKEQPETVEEPVVQTPIVQSSSPKMKKNETSDLDIASFELSEEEQARLLEEYEQEIKEREKVKTDDPVVENPKPQSKAAKKASNVQSKGATANAPKGKTNKDLTKNQHQQQKSTQQQKSRGPERSKPKKEELPIEKDHFKKESESSTSDESWEKDFDV